MRKLNLTITFSVFCIVSTFSQTWTTYDYPFFNFQGKLIRIGDTLIVGNNSDKTNQLYKFIEDDDANSISKNSLNTNSLLIITKILVHRKNSIPDSYFLWTENLNSTKNQLKQIGVEIQNAVKSKEIVGVNTTFFDKIYWEEPTLNQNSQSNNQELSQSLDKTQLYAKVSSEVVTLLTYLNDDDYKNNKPFMQGSGILVDNKGTIITNFHVMKGFPKHISIFANNVIYESNDIMYWDELQDIAFLKSNYISDHFVQFGDVDKLKIGEPVVAIGSPHGFGGTISEGIISGPLRFLKGIKVLQHNAAISPGSSGGALFNANGELIGLNTLSENNAQNINFAIPADVIKNYMIYFFSPTHVDPREKKLFEKASNADESKNYKDAISYYQDILNIDPKQPLCYFQIGNMYQFLNDPTEAEIFYKRFLQIVDSSNIVFFDKIAFVRSQLGFIYSQQKKFDQAIYFFNLALQFNPKDISVYVGLADAYLNLHDAQNAFHTATLAIQIDPDDDKGYLARGSIYESESQWDLACIDFRMAKQKAPLNHFGDNLQLYLNMYNDAINKCCKN